MIRALPRDVVDRIAAGEVVERPASVVKELIENALDAGARRIDVTIAGGGLELVRVADDGHGIAADDLPLAFAAHATSKLEDVGDLAHIASFGFRGEALASIGAVARCRISSATSDDGAGLRIACEGGRLGVPTPVAAPRGSVVEVRDLFFNTPARRAFLGATRTESARCREVVSALSLVHATVAFRLTLDGKERLAGAADRDLDARLATVYDREFVATLLPVDGHEGGLRLTGRLAAPSAARPRPRAQLLFVNGRLVRDRGVISAVRVACKDFLPGSLQPSWVLELSCDPAAVDVNVHPTKAEVRFRDREQLFGLVRRSCRAALLRADLAPRARLSPPLGPSATSAWTSGGDSPAPPRTPGSWQAEALALHPARADRPQAPAFPGTAGGPLPAAERRAHPHQPALIHARPAVRFLQVLDTYLVHDGPDGLVIVDQHALHERILYARLQRALEHGRMESQRLLVPVTVRLDPVDHALALDLIPALATLGLEVAPFGNDLVAISAVPAVLRNESLEQLLRDMIHPRDQHGGMPHDLDRRLFTIACHAAVKAGDPLDETQAQALLEQGAELEHDSTCPHGRPTRLVVDRSELERLFKRSGF